MSFSNDLKTIQIDYAICCKCGKRLMNGKKCLFRYYWECPTCGNTVKTFKSPTELKERAIVILQSENEGV